MFGFSLPKLLFTILIIAVVWYGFKALGRIQERRESTERKAAPGKTARRKPPPVASDPDTEDMVACPKCGTYVPARGATSCGREDCPYPG